MDRMDRDRVVQVRRDRYDMANTQMRQQIDQDVTVSQTLSRKLQRQKNYTELRLRSELVNYNYGKSWNSIWTNLLYHNS